MVGKGCRRNLQKNLDRKNHTIQRRVHHTTQRKEKEGSHATQREEGTTHKGEEEESHHANGEDHSTQMAGTTPQKRENHTAGRTSTFRERTILKSHVACVEQWSRVVAHRGIWKQVSTECVRC